MKEKSFQHVISYSDNEFCIEGTWITDCMNPCKSLYDQNEDIIRSPPIFFQNNIFYLSFYFDTDHELFKIFIDMDNDITDNFPVSVNLIMKNLYPEKTLHFQSQLFFTPQTKHGIATFNKKTSLEIFSDEGFSFDGFFIFQYSFKHKKNSNKSPLKYNLYSQNLSFIDHASKYLPKQTNIHPIINNCKYAGISNQGATCYLNSVLQALFHIPAFRSLLYQVPITETDKTTKTMIYNLQKLFAQMENSNAAASTRDLTKSFGWTSAESFKQNDAQELLRVFLESLEKKLKNRINDQKLTNNNNSNENDDQKSTNNNNSNENDNQESTNNDNSNENDNQESTNNDNSNENDNQNSTNNDNSNENDISDLFKFQVTQYIECPDVSFRNSRVDDYLDLAVEVRGCKNLYQSFKKFTMAEKLDSPYSTDEFGPQKAIMYNKFKNLPKVLFIHLKRFEFRVPGITERFVNKISSNFQPTNNLTKINDKFEFPKVINLSEFIEQTNNEDWTYELFGVLVHSGSSSFGHYYAYIRPENSNQWFKFNDSIVNECSEIEAVNQNYGDGSNCASGYMLIYMRRRDLPQLFTETVKPPKELLVKEEVEEPKKEKKIEPAPKKVETKPKIKSDEYSIFYNFNIFGTNLLQVKIITDENLRDGCNECSLAISNLNTNKDGYYRGKQAPYIFHDSGIILIHRSATERELFERISSFFSTKEKENQDELPYYLQDEDSVKKKNIEKFDLYMMNLNSTEGTITKKLEQTDDQISYFGQNDIYVFYRSKSQKEKSKNLNINNYIIDYTDEEEEEISEADKKDDNKEDDKENDSQYFPIMDIDGRFDRLIKSVYNSTVYITSSILSATIGTKNIVTRGVDSIKTKNQEIVSKIIKKSKRTRKGDKILIFLKVFDYKRQEIRFLKTKNVYHDDELSILLDDALNFFFPDEKSTSKANIQFYSKKYSTIFDVADPSKSFKENKIYNGCIIIMQNMDEKIDMTKKEIIDSNTTSISKEKNEEKIKKLETKIEYPPRTNSLLDYIDTKYNMCNAIVSSYDYPSDYLFILRFSFNNNVSNLKCIVARAAGIETYDPQKNSIILYTQHLNSDDEPNNSPLSSYHSRLSSPLNRIFFRFFTDTPESKIGQMVPVKVWMDDIELKSVLAPRSGTVKDVIQKLCSQTDSPNPELYEVSLDKSGAVLCPIPHTFKIFNITSNTCIHMSLKKDENKNQIAVCHTKGIKLFVPFYFNAVDDEEFGKTKHRLKEEIRRHSNEKNIDANSFDSLLDSLLITIHHLNKSMFDTMKPTNISDNDKLSSFVNNDKTNFLFVELPKEKPQSRPEPKKNNNVIFID